MKDTEWIIWHETMLQSVATDLFTMATLVGAIVIGKFVGSEALQWIGGAMAVITIIAFKPKYRHTFTNVDDAKAYLDSLKK